MTTDKAHVRKSISWGCEASPTFADLCFLPGGDALNAILSWTCQCFPRNFINTSFRAIQNGGTQWSIPLSHFRPGGSCPSQADRIEGSDVEVEKYNDDYDDEEDVRSTNGTRRTGSIRKFTSKTGMVQTNGLLYTMVLGYISTFLFIIYCLLQ